MGPHRLPTLGMRAVDKIFGVALFMHTTIPAVLGLNLKVTVRIFIGKVDGFIMYFLKSGFTVNKGDT